MRQTTPLRADDRRDLAEASQAIQAQLQAAGNAADIQMLIGRAAEAALHGKLCLGEPFDQPAVLAWALAAWWGNTLCDDLGWRWVGIQHGTWQGMGVTDAKQCYLALPFDLFHRIVVDRNHETPGAPVRYNAIQAWQAGQPSPLPRAAPGDLLVVTS